MFFKKTIEEVKEPFGTQTHFENYLESLFEKEGAADRFEFAHRVHFTMTATILELAKGKDALDYITNLTQAVDKFTEYKKSAFEYVFEGE